MNAGRRPRRLRDWLPSVVVLVIAAGCWPSGGDPAVSETTLAQALLFRENGNVKDQWFGYTPLILAALHGEAAQVRELLAAGAEVNWRMDWGYTALIVASGQGQAAIVRDLLAAGADPHRRTDEGRSALDYARAEGFTEVAELLAPLPQEAPPSLAEPDVPAQEDTAEDHA